MTGVEVIGISPVNKGARLMLDAITAQLRQQLPKVKIAVPISSPAEMRLAHGVWGSLSRELIGVRGVFTATEDALLNALPAATRHRYGLLSPSELNIVLDASGFAYGDYWGLAKLQRRLVHRLPRWRAQGRKLVLLPQSLGPFEEPGMKDAFRRVLDQASLVYVRDKLSWRYVSEIDAGRPNVRYAPDFTNLLKPLLPEHLTHLSGKALIIPNEKMIAGTNKHLISPYLAFLNKAVEVLTKLGNEVALLVHEGTGDRRLAAAVADQAADRIQVIENDSPLVTKAIIASARLVVSSRYHGLVSALSSGVPALACGWSHKYQELLADYNSEESIIDLALPEQWDRAIELLHERAQDNGYLAGLRHAAEQERERSSSVWPEVLSVIQQREIQEGHGIP